MLVSNEELALLKQTPRQADAEDVANLCEDLENARAYIGRLADEAAEHRHSFEIRWRADMRAIERWQAAHPGNDLVWPDHADLVVWLMERHAALLDLARNVGGTSDDFLEATELSGFRFTIREFRDQARACLEMNHDPRTT